MEAMNLPLRKTAEQPRRPLVIGLMAHVDAGKTTLSEGLLYTAGSLRSLGRVDERTSFLDPEKLEKQRGITIFTHQAQLDYHGQPITLLDMPGHIDFADQVEQSLAVLDVAILVVSASDGVEATTLLWWQILARLGIPTILVVNKIDTAGFDRAALLAHIQARLGEKCIDYGGPDDVVPRGGASTEVDGERDSSAVGLADYLTSEAAEQLAGLDDRLLMSYLDDGSLDEQVVRELFATRALVPVLFASALHLQGVTRLLSLLTHLAEPRFPQQGISGEGELSRSDNLGPHQGEFGARVFRISHDSKGLRLTWVRVTSGQLAAKQEVKHQAARVSDGQAEGEGFESATNWLKQGDEQGEKVDEIRVYDGAKFTTVSSVQAGDVCTLVGPQKTWPGQGLGCESDCAPASVRPVLLYSAHPAPGEQADDHAVLVALRQLAEEDPLLNVTWNETAQRVELSIMGEIQLETITQRLRDEYHLAVECEDAGVVYQETISKPIEGVGHFEPLRHYAEVHVLLEPGPRGSGISLRNATPANSLAPHWQRDIMHHLAEKMHKGVLLGAPLTDVKITLLGGAANIKHTSGGDFREATYRAVREGLMFLKQQQACVLLEPRYRFRLEVPVEQLGRAMSDVERMHGRMDPPQMPGGSTAGGAGVSGSAGASGGAGAAGFGAGFAVVEGEAPVSQMRGYAREVRAYTQGKGSFSCVFASSAPVDDQESVVEAAQYDPMKGVEDTPDSVFCAHGAGFTVDWKDVPRLQHLPNFWQPGGGH